MGNGKSDFSFFLFFFSPPTTFDEGLGTSSPAEMPYPAQASVSEARQLKRRLMESSRSLAAAAAHTTEVWAQGFCQQNLFFFFFILFYLFLFFLQKVSAISATSAMLPRQPVCWRSRRWLISACRFALLQWVATPWIEVLTPVLPASVSFGGGVDFVYSSAWFKVVESPWRRYCLVLSLTSKRADRDPWCRRAA